MRTSAIKFSMLTAITLALAAAPAIRSAYAAGGDTPTPPPASDSKAKTTKKKKNDTNSSIDDPRFLAGYRTAFTTIYDRHDYTGAIDQRGAGLVSNWGTSACRVSTAMCWSSDPVPPGFRRPCAAPSPDSA